jgi:hypothetical protein
MTSRQYIKAALLAISFLPVDLAPAGQSSPVAYDFSFGQSAPGNDPQLFLPGALETDDRGGFGFVFPDVGGETYFTLYKKKGDTPGDIARMKFVDGAWQEPELLPLNSDTYENDATISGDGNTLIFRSWRALPNGTRPEGHSYLWIAHRDESGWGPPQPLLAGGQPLRTGFPSLARSGSVYFAARHNDVAGIYRIRPAGDTYLAPEFVVDPAQPPLGEGDMFVDPDERYIIVSIYHRDDKGVAQGGDLYVLYHREDGSWSSPVPFGPKINSNVQENCPQVTPDGRFLVFNRYDRKTMAGSTWWLDASVIDRLRPQGE